MINRSDDLHKFPYNVGDWVSFPAKSNEDNIYFFIIIYAKFQCCNNLWIFYRKKFCWFFSRFKYLQIIKKKDKFNFFVTSIPLRTGTIFPVDREISPIKIDNFRIKLELCKTSIFLRCSQLHKSMKNDTHENKDLQHTAKSQETWKFMMHCVCTFECSFVTKFTSEIFWAHNFEY